MGYQGVFPADDDGTHAASTVAEFYPMSPFEFYGMMNFMKIGIVFSDAVTTVSETYAREIQESAEFGYGLEGVVREPGRSSDRNHQWHRLWNLES